MIQIVYIFSVAFLMATLWQGAMSLATRIFPKLVLKGFLWAPTPWKENDWKKIKTWAMWVALGCQTALWIVGGIEIFLQTLGSPEGIQIEGVEALAFIAGAVLGLFGPLEKAFFMGLSYVIVAIPYGIVWGFSKILSLNIGWVGKLILIAIKVGLFVLLWIIVWKQFTGL